MGIVTMSIYFAGALREDGSTEATIESWVVVTTLLLLLKFFIGSMGPWFFSSRRLVIPVVGLLHRFISYSVSYTLELMKPPAAAASPTGDGGGDDDTMTKDMFQVWVVLIVTMEANARIGSPYRDKKMNILDLLSSLWSANQLLRTRTRLNLMVPLWLIWFIHALRIVWYDDVSLRRATEAGHENIKLVGDYMATSLHTDDDASPTTMRGYRYIVVGEEEQVTEVRQPGFTFEMDLTSPGSPQLLTLDKVWHLMEDSNDDRLLSSGADTNCRFKDVCLSFALYKLQRRRFFDFPIAEATHPATSRLIPVTAKLARIMFRIINRGRWDQKIVQYNLLMAMFPGTKRLALGRFYTWWHGMIRAFVPRKVKLQKEVRKVVFRSMKNLVSNVPSSPRSSCRKNPSELAWAEQMNSLLMSYFRNAFVDTDDGSSPPLIEDTTAELHSETHKILVWHIATSLCYINLLEEAGELVPGGAADLYAALPKTAFAGGDGNLAAAWPHLIAAVSLSNYCAYLVTQALVPDNGLVASRFLDAVCGEVRDALAGCATVGEIPGRLGSLACDERASKTMIAGMAARLWEELMAAHAGSEAAAGL